MTSLVPDLVLMAVLVLLLLRIRRGRKLVSAWAASNGYRIVRRLWGGFRLSPFPLAAFGKQSIHYLEVEDNMGRRGRVWLKVGDFIVGHLDDRVEAAWDQQPSGAV